MANTFLGNHTLICLEEKGYLVHPVTVFILLVTI